MSLLKQRALKKQSRKRATKPIYLNYVLIEAKRKKLRLARRLKGIFFLTLFHRPNSKLYFLQKYRKLYRLKRMSRGDRG